MATDRAVEAAAVDPLVEKVARAIHEGLGGNGWAYTDYGGDELHNMRTELLSAARAALAAAEGAAWQPLETARGRQTPVLAWDAETQEYAIAIWSVCEGVFEGLVTVPDGSGIASGKWRPLPSPPPASSGNA